MDQGYVKLWRKTIQSQVFQNEGLLKIWVWCLMKASYKNRCIGFASGKGGIEIDIGPGQFVFGRDSAAKELKMDPSTVWKRINKLKNLENITIESNKQYSLITINNWATYQEENIESNSESNRQVTGKEQASNTNKKDKKEKNNKYTDDFDVFYKAYPIHQGRGAAEKAWNKNGRPPLETILKAILSQVLWRKSAKPGEFRPPWKHPATWLNQKCWEDEVEVEQSTGPFG